MDAEVECSHSVPDLVTHLATLLLKKELAPHKPTAADVAKKRTRIYEALFLSGSMPTQSKLELFDEVSRELQDDCKHWKSLKDLRVLLGDRTLEESVETEDAENDSAKNYIRVLRPEPLRLVESYEPDTTQEFMKYRFSTVLNSMDQMQRALKPIQLKPLTNFFRMNPISKPPQPLGVKFQLPKTSGFTGIAESMSRMRNSKGQRHFLPFRMPNLKKKQPSVEKEPEFICEAESQKIFMSDHMLTNDLKLYANKDLVLSYIEESVLVEHLKRAAAGLQSETIIISTKDSHKLLLKPHIALRTVLPEVVAEFADPFLRSGRALRRISARVRRSSHMVTRLERPVTRALREALVEFISNSREFLLSIRANSITHLLTCSLPTMLLLQHLEKMFHHEPRLNFDGEVTGPFLLSCIWSAIDNCSNSNFLQLLIYLLRSICQTYFVHLKRWLFQGELDETMNEIFITRSLNSSHTAFDEGSKEFFDRGYMVIKESVPNFLTGCEDDILQCGKYNQVLRAYNPQHPVFDVELPEIVVCLEEQQLKEARRNLAEKYSAIYQRFGWCSMQSIFEKRMAAKRSYKNLMVERTQAYLAAWEENQQILLLEANAQKKLRYEELNNQKALQEKLRLEQRRQEVVRELAFQAECERMEDLKLEKLKPELEMEVANLQRELESDKEYQDMLSPDPSISDRSFVSCMEGPDSQQNSSVENNEEGLDKDPEATDDVESGFLSARGVPYHRTESDVVNSNEQPILQTELSRNRQHMQSSEQFQECQTWVKLNQQSKSQRTESDAPLPSDLNANVSEPLSELQINRLRMNHHDPFESFNSTEDEHMKRMQISLASETERARNRRRVMDSEYNIILGEAWTRKSNNSMNLPLESNKLHVDVSLAMLTPMSTTSDVDIGSLTPAKDTSDSSNNDEANNNNQGIDSHRFPIEKEKVSRCLDQVSASFKPTFLLPTNEILISATKTQTEKLAKGSTPSKIPKNCNPFMIRRCLQLSIMAPVNAHYALLRNEVLRIFQELHIYDHFRKLRNYFFLLDGQFGTLLTCDILGRIKAGVDPRSLCQKGILDAILSHALASGSDEITVAQNLVLNCSTIPDSLNLFSVEATSMLMLHCKVDWPLNLVISPETIAKYGEVFGYLLKLRHVTFVLEGTFDHLQQMGKLLGAELRTASHFRHLQMARHKLAHFMTSLQTHLVANALQGSWEKFKEQLGSVNSIEGLYQEHAMYLKRVAFMAHLNRRSAKVRETIDKMLIIILRFCKVIHSESFIRDNDNDNVFIHPRFKRLMQEEAEFEKFMLYLLYLGNKAATSGYQEEIGDLISVINFNKYYKVADQESVS